MIDISKELAANTAEFKGIINSKHVTTVAQLVAYLAEYGYENLPDELANAEAVHEAHRLILQAMSLIEGVPLQLIALRPQVERTLELNREKRIMLQSVRDVFK